MIVLSPRSPQGKILRLGDLVRGALQGLRPVLICTSSVEESEEILRYLEDLQGRGYLRHRGPLGTSR